MKLKHFTAISIFLLLFSQHRQVSACGPFPSPSLYTINIYRIIDTEDTETQWISPDAPLPSAEVRLVMEKTKNILLWKKQISKKISDKDIQKVVYNCSSEQIENIYALLTQGKEEDIPKDLKQNSFIRHLMTTRDVKAIKLLVLAKKSEEIRSALNDTWNYHTRQDQAYAELDSIAKEAMAYRENYLLDRYALQAVRALFATEQYERCIEYWLQIEKRIPSNVIRDMITGYIAGCYAHTGEATRAMKVFFQNGDLESIQFILEKEKLDAFTVFADQAPDSPYAPFIIQRQLNRFGFVDYVFKEAYKYISANATDDKLQHALKAAKAARKPDNKAYWFYAAAAISAELQFQDTKQKHSEVLNKQIDELDFNTDYESGQELYNKLYSSEDLPDLSDPNSAILTQKQLQQAMDYLTEAEKHYNNPVFLDYTHLLRIFFEAMTRTYDSSYEQWLEKEILWIEKKVDENIIPYKSRKQLQLKNNITDYDIIDPFFQYKNHTFFFGQADFWNKAARKILLKAAVPKAMAVGKTTRALQYSNYAENTTLIYQSLNFPLISIKPNYNNNTFKLADHLTADQLAAYIDILMHPNDPLDSLLNAGSYREINYWREMTGTHYLREMRYAAAIRYLTEVDFRFQYSINLINSECMNRDPFAATNCHTSRGAGRHDYKLDFATRMRKLQDLMFKTEDPDSLCEIRLKFTTGMFNSFHECWALTHYYKTSGGWLNEDNGPYTNWTLYLSPLIKNIEKNRHKEFELFKDPERKAAALLKYGHRKEIMEHYSHTTAAEFLREHCDEWKDYVPSHLRSKNSGKSPNSGIRIAATSTITTIVLRRFRRSMAKKFEDVKNIEKRNAEKVNGRK